MLIFGSTNETGLFESIPSGIRESGWFIAGLVVGAVVGWILKQAKRAAEIVKLRADVDKLHAEANKLASEAATNAGDILEKVQKFRDAYRDACVACTGSASNLLAVVKKNSPLPKIEKAREELCGVLLDRTIPAYHAYVEWEHLRRSGDSLQIESFVVEQVALELGRFATWLETANHPNLLTALSRTPARIDKSTLKPFLDLAHGTPVDKTDTVKALLSGVLERIYRGGNPS